MRPCPLLVLCPGCVYRDYTPGLAGRLPQDVLDGSYTPVSLLPVAAAATMSPGTGD
jgi:hypothetical protein